MSPLEIQFELKIRRITQKEIAEGLGVSEMGISKVVNKSMTSDRIMKAVSKAIGRDHREVFSEYYARKKRRQKAA